MIFGQLAAAATTNEVVDNGIFKRVVTQINVCNRTGGALTFRIYVVKADETLGTQHAYVYDISLAANDRAVFTDDIPLELSDKIFFYASNTGLSVSVFGVQSG